MTKKQLIKEYKAIDYFQNRLRRALWRSRLLEGKTTLGGTRQLTSVASESIQNSLEEVRKVFVEQFGQMDCYEIERGHW